MPFDRFEDAVVDLADDDAGEEHNEDHETEVDAAHGNHNLQALEAPDERQSDEKEREKPHADQDCGYSPTREHGVIGERFEDGVISIVGNAAEIEQRREEEECDDVEVHMMAHRRAQVDRDEEDANEKVRHGQADDENVCGRAQFRAAGEEKANGGVFEKYYGRHDYEKRGGCARMARLCRERVASCVWHFGCANGAFLTWKSGRSRSCLEIRVVGGAFSVRLRRAGLVFGLL